MQATSWECPKPGLGQGTLCLEAADAVDLGRNIDVKSTETILSTSCETMHRVWGSERVKMKVVVVEEIHA